MNNQTRRLFPILIILGLISFACTLGGIGGATTQNEGAQSTSVAQTVVSELTRSALQTAFAGGTSSTPQSTWTSAPAGATLTMTPSPTATVVIPTATATATSTNTPLPTATSTSIPCNQAKFEADVTIPDNTQLSPGTSITKTWRLKNIGTCTWTTDYSLAFYNGASMSGPAAVNLTSSVAPGQTVDISVNLVAPASAGTYTGYWKLRTNTGATFGLGAGAANPFWVTIEVTAAAPTVNPNAPLDFIASYCQATWTNQASTTISCNSAENFTNGSVSYTSNPLIEYGYQDDEPTIIVIPANGSGGTIYGKYPAVTVQAGDHIVGRIGCMANSPNCSVVFKIDYIEGSNAAQNLGTWTEVYDDTTTALNVDLSTIVGKTVQFILTVTNSNGSSSDDRAFWEAVHIER